jgi:hypothetical protein
VHGALVVNVGDILQVTVVIVYVFCYKYDHIFYNYLYKSYSAR